MGVDWFGVKVAWTLGAKVYGTYVGVQLDDANLIEDEAGATSIDVDLNAHNASPLDPAGLAGSASWRK